MTKTCGVTWGNGTRNKLQEAGALIFYLLSLPELPGIHVLHSVEEAGEGGDFGKMELVGDLGNAHRCLAQQEHGLHQ